MSEGNNGTELPYTLAMQFSDTDEAVTAIIFKVHHIPPPAHALPQMRQTYWILGSNKSAFESWVRTMTAVIDGAFLIL